MVSGDIFLNKQFDHDQMQPTLTTSDGAIKLADTSAPKSKSRFGGLSTKLLLLTVGFVMLSEVFVFLPSVAKTG